MGVDVVSGLDAAPFLEKVENYQSGWESLDDGGADYATGVTKANSAMNGVFDGSSAVSMSVDCNIDLLIGHRISFSFGE